MATVSIDIPAGSNARVKAMVQAIAPNLLPESALPAGKTPDKWTNAEALAILKLMILRFVLDLVKQVEVETAAQAARQAAIASVDTGGIAS